MEVPLPVDADILAIGFHEGVHAVRQRPRTVAHPTHPEVGLDDQIHLALTKGKWNDDEPVLVRINSTLVNNDILGTLTNDGEKKLDDMFRIFNKEGKGAIVFINQEYQSYNLLTRLKYLKESQSPEEVAKAPKIPMDSKDIGIGAQILHDLNIHKIRLVSNSVQTKRVGMIGYGLEITEYVNY